jgi:ketosteroid isomerase-like protein
MMSENNVNVIALKQAYRLWRETKTNSVDDRLDLMTEDIKFQSLAGGANAMQFTRTSDSKQQVGDYFAGLSADWEMIDYRVDEYIAQGDRVVALCHCSFKNKRTGKILDTPKADFHKFRDGKICDFFEFYDTAQAIGVATAP